MNCGTMLAIILIQFVSVGIGGSYLGSKVIFDVNVVHFGITTVQRNATAIHGCIFAGILM